MKRTYETECDRIKQKYEVLLSQKTDRKTLKCLVLTYCYWKFLAENGQNRPLETVRKQKREEILAYLNDFPELEKSPAQIEELMTRVTEKAAKATEILNCFQKELKAYSQSVTGYLYHVTAQENLTAIAASHQRLNMYHTSSENAVFATSSRLHTLLYAGRALAEDMQVSPSQHRCIYNINPFQYETEDLWKLRHPVCICMLNYDDFIPVIDFIEASPGNFRICFEYEWTAFKEEERIAARETLESLDKKLLSGYQFYTSDPAGQLKRIG